MRIFITLKDACFYRVKIEQLAIRTFYYFKYIL